MPDSQQTANGQSAATPSGAVFHPLARPAVSDEFIRSLQDDGVSRETIKSIKRENARVAEPQDDSA